jgi:DNA-binding NarL/FixJ family response regulator
VSRGADSYVLKGTSSDELVATIQAVAAGESRMAPEIAQMLVNALRAPRSVRLTDREREILLLLADGLSNRAIGARLHITERTVKYHVSEILARLGAESRAQAVAIAQRRGMLSPPRE